MHETLFEDWGQKVFYFGRLTLGDFFLALQSNVNKTMGHARLGKNLLNLLIEMKSSKPSRFKDEKP